MNTAHLTKQSVYIRWILLVTLDNEGRQQAQPPPSEKSQNRASKRGRREQRNLFRSCNAQRRAFYGTSQIGDSIDYGATQDPYVLYTFDKTPPCLGGGRQAFRGGVVRYLIFAPVYNKN